MPEVREIITSAPIREPKMLPTPPADLQLATQRILGGDRWISSSLVSKLAYQRAVPTSSTAIWLTRRQRELLRLLTQGLDNRNIAQTLEISIKTVENHLTALYRVLGVDSRLKAVHYALRHPELRERENKLARDSSFYCSAFVQHLFRKSGIDLAPGLDAKNTTPEDISRTPVPHTTYLLQRAVATSKLKALAGHVRRRVKAKIRRAD